MSWEAFAGSGVHNWLVAAALLLLFLAWVRAVELDSTRADLEREASTCVPTATPELEIR